MERNKQQTTHIHTHSPVLVPLAGLIELNMRCITLSRNCVVSSRDGKENLNRFLAAHFNVPTKNTDRMIVDKIRLFTIQKFLDTAEFA